MVQRLSSSVSLNTLKAAVDTLQVGRLNVSTFGARGDGINEDRAAIQAALDYANTNFGGGCIVFPEGTYKCDGPLKYYDNQTLEGTSRFKPTLVFTDTSGIIPADLDSTLTTYVAIRNLHIKGNAATSLSATATVGLHIKNTRDSTFADLIIEDFVDGVSVDADTKGGPFNTLNGVTVLQAKYPNTINGYPRYGMRFTGDTKQSQCATGIGIRLYAQISNQTNDFDGDGSTNTFEIDFSTKQIGWYKEAGLQVFVRDANGNWVAKANGTDYDLYALNSIGSATVIPSGTVNISTVNGRAGYVNYQAVKARVVFRAGKIPVSGSANIRLRWSDPTGVAGICFEKATGNILLPSGIAGYTYAIDAQSGPNTAIAAYTQFCYNYANIGANASESTLYSVDYQDGSVIGNRFVYDSSARRMTIAPNGRVKPASAYLTSTQSTSSTSLMTLAWNYPSTFLTNGPDATSGLTVTKGVARSRSYWEGERNITVSLDYNISSTNTSSKFVIQIDVSYDQGTTWSLLKARTFGKSVSTGTISDFGVALMQDNDSTILSRVGGSLFYAYYRVSVKVVDNHATLNITGGSIAIEEVMAS